MISPRVGRWMRKLADRIDPPKSFGTGNPWMSVGYGVDAPIVRTGKPEVHVVERGTFESGGQTKQMGPRPTISTGSGSGTDWRPDHADVVLAFMQEPGWMREAKIGRP